MKPYLERTSIEVPCQRRGLATYRRVEAAHLVTASGKQYPPMRLQEAKRELTKALKAYTPPPATP